MWDKNIHAVTKMAGKYPQKSYAVVVRAIQLEWIFLQHVIKYIGQAFVVVGKVLRENFLPHIFFEKLRTVPPIVGDLSTLL